VGSGGFFVMNTIETKRLELRLYTDNERSDFVKLLTDSAVMKYVDRGVLSARQAEALWHKLIRQSYPSGVDTIWAAFAKDDGRYVGNASIRPRPERREDWEIGYYLAAAEWGNGLGTEMAARLVRYGFDELELPAVYATVYPANAASRKVLEKIGMNIHTELADEKGSYYLYRVARPENF
jgi:RimJ/RimL family protein N-acetyltransferase